MGILLGIGDRVVCNRSIVTNHGRISPGDMGTIYYAEDGEIGVCWDDNIGGHDLWGKCEPGHGWFFSDYEIGKELGDHRILSRYDSSDDEPFDESEEMAAFMDFMRKEA